MSWHSKANVEKRNATSSAPTTAAVANARLKNEAGGNNDTSLSSSSAVQHNSVSYGNGRAPPTLNSYGSQRRLLPTQNSRSSLDTATMEDFNNHTSHSNSSFNSNAPLLNTWHGFTENSQDDDRPPPVPPPRHPQGMSVYNKLYSYAGVNYTSAGAPQGNLWNPTEQDKNKENLLEHSNRDSPSGVNNDFVTYNTEAAKWSKPWYSKSQSSWSSQNYENWDHINNRTIDSDKESSNNVPEPMVPPSHYPSQPITDELSKGPSSPPAPPVRNASSLKFSFFNQSHEKYPSWPVTSSSSAQGSDTNIKNVISSRAKSFPDNSNNGGGGQLVKKPKMTNQPIPHPVQEKSSSSSHAVGRNYSSENELRSPKEPSYQSNYVHRARVAKVYNVGTKYGGSGEGGMERKVDFQKFYNIEPGYSHPQFDSDGREKGDKDYTVPSPPERDIPLEQNAMQTSPTLPFQSEASRVEKLDDLLQHYTHYKAEARQNHNNIPVALSNSTSKLSSSMPANDILSHQAPGLVQTISSGTQSGPVTSLDNEVFSEESGRGRGGGGSAANQQQAGEEAFSHTEPYPGYTYIVRNKPCYNTSTQTDSFQTLSSAWDQQHGAPAEPKHRNAEVQVDGGLYREASTSPTQPGHLATHNEKASQARPPSWSSSSEHSSLSRPHYVNVEKSATSPSWSMSTGSDPQNSPVPLSSSQEHSPLNPPPGTGRPTSWSGSVHSSDNEDRRYGGYSETRDSNGRLTTTTVMDKLQQEHRIPETIDENMLEDLQRGNLADVLRPLQDYTPSTAPLLRKLSEEFFREKYRAQIHSHNYQNITTGQQPEPMKPYHNEHDQSHAGYRGQRGPEPMEQTKTKMVENGKSTSGSAPTETNHSNWQNNEKTEKVNDVMDDDSRSRERSQSHDPKERPSRKISMKKAFGIFDNSGGDGQGIHGRSQSYSNFSLKSLSPTRTSKDKSESKHDKKEKKEKKKSKDKNKEKEREKDKKDSERLKFNIDPRNVFPERKGLRRTTSEQIRPMKERAREKLKNSNTDQSENRHKLSDPAQADLVGTEDDVFKRPREPKRSSSVEKNQEDEHKLSDPGLKKFQHAALLSFYQMKTGKRLSSSGSLLSDESASRGEPASPQDAPPQLWNDSAVPPGGKAIEPFERISKQERMSKSMSLPQNLRANYQEYEKQSRKEIARSESFKKRRSAHELQKEQAPEKARPKPVIEGHLGMMETFPPLRKEAQQEVPGSSSSQTSADSFPPKWETLSNLAEATTQPASDRNGHQEQQQSSQQQPPAARHGAAPLQVKRIARPKTLMMRAKVWCHEAF